MSADAGAMAGRVALVTGAGSGIGRSCAASLAAAGARVAIVDIDAERARAAADEIRGAAGVAIPLAVDISDSAAVDAAFATAIEHFGTVDVALNCAGIGPRGRVLEMSDEEWRRVMAVNLDGSFYVARAAARHMVQRRRGSIILISSNQALIGGMPFAHYGASKAALIVFAQALAEEIGEYGVTVNVINPGLTATPLALRELTDDEWARRAARNPLRRLGRPSDVAAVVLFLAGPASRFMTGQLVNTRMKTFDDLPGSRDWVLEDLEDARRDA